MLVAVRLALLLVIAFAGNAVAQPYPPYPYPPPQPYLPPPPRIASPKVEPAQKPPMWGEARFILGGGISRIGKPTRDLQPSLSTGGQAHVEITSYFSLGGWLNVHLRNWEDVPRVYRDVSCETGDTECRSDALYPVAWGVVFGMFEAGWEFTVHRTRAETTPWFSFGTGFGVISDAEKVAVPGKSQVVYGHVGRIGVGWDVSKTIGIGLRGTFANDTNVFRTNGPSMQTLIVSVEFREWSDWNKPAPKKKRN
jgi:hypothetical protein